MSSAPDPTSDVEDSLPFTVDALLIDMDGTLVDSGPAVERSWNAFFREHGSDRTFDASLHGVPARQVIAEVLPELGPEQREAGFRRIEDLEVADVDGIEILPGAQRLLEELDRAGGELGRPVWTIVTSCTSRLFEARWSRTGLPHPDTIVTADQVTRGKPDPEPYELGARRLDVEPAQALAIEDSVGGLRSAREAGCPTLAVTTTTPAAELRPLADALVTSLDDIEVGVAGGRLRVGRRGA